MDMSDPDAYMNPQQAEALADKIGQLLYDELCKSCPDNDEEAIVNAQYELRQSVLDILQDSGLANI